MWEKRCSGGDFCFFLLHSCDIKLYPLLFFEMILFESFGNVGKWAGFSIKDWYQWVIWTIVDPWIWDISADQLGLGPSHWSKSHWLLVYGRPRRTDLSEIPLEIVMDSY